MTKAQKTFIAIQKRQSEPSRRVQRSPGCRDAKRRTGYSADGARFGELTDTETEFRTAADALLTEQATVTAPGGEDAEARERRELCGRANAGDDHHGRDGETEL